MLPETLQKILDSTDYAESDIDILKLDISADPLKMEFIINDAEGSINKARISMTAYNAKDFYIDKEGRSSYIHMEIDHPLLWRFNDAQCDLYISEAQPKQIEKVVFELLKIHTSLFKLYLPFDLHFLNILNSGYGLFEKGPKKLLTLFADSLNNNGIKTSMVCGTIPDKRERGLRILFLGLSYVIAEEFDFKVTDK